MAVLMGIVRPEGVRTQRHEGARHPEVPVVPGGAHPWRFILIWVD